jgi:titin
VYSNGGGTSTTFALIGTVTTAGLREFRHNTSAVTAGTTFKYKVRAVNLVGEGPQTSEISIISATVPDKPAAPTKASASKTSIAVNWVAPSTGGSPITGYTL